MCLIESCIPCFLRREIQRPPSSSDLLFGPLGLGEPIGSSYSPPVPSPSQVRPSPRGHLVYLSSSNEETEALLAEGTCHHRTVCGMITGSGLRPRPGLEPASATDVHMTRAGPLSPLEKSCNSSSFKAVRINGYLTQSGVQNTINITFYLLPTTSCHLLKAMATHSSVLAWRILGTGEPGGLPSMGSHRVGHD